MGQEASERPAGLEAKIHARLVTLEGFVLEPGGSPAEGAVVVSSAGGRALTDAAGNYRLEVTIATAVTGVQVTAVGNGSSGRLGSASVMLGAATRAWVEPLTLSLGASCSPRWLPTFGAQPGVYQFVIRALVVHDDGSGPALFVGGSFDLAGGVRASGVARWDGEAWSAVGTLDYGSVNALAVFDDGAGPALYAAGNMALAGAVGGHQIARWDGSSWSTLSEANNALHALVVHDDGSGSALYAAGRFTLVGAVASNRIARWDGSSWSSLGTGLTTPNASPTAYALAVHDDGGGPALYVGGSFTRAGGLTVNRVARWNGSAWSTLGSGLGGPAFALASFDDGSGPALYAGGEFLTAGGAPASHVAAWDGASWSPLGSGTSGPVQALRAWDDGSGPRLYAGGEFVTAGSVSANGIGSWDGTGWSSLSSGTTWPASGSSSFPPVLALLEHDDGRGPALFAAGHLYGAGGLGMNRIARWNGASWSGLGTGFDWPVFALVAYDDGSGPALYAGGGFTSIGGVTIRGIARWDGSAWSSVGGGIDGPDPAVLSLRVHDDGSGPALHAGGRFELAGGVPANNIARWDGTSWSALGTGLQGAVFGQLAVYALASHDAGGGAQLYAAGAFSLAGGVPAGRVARWDGTSWSAVGTGMILPVRTLASYDDGGGPELYAGGGFHDADGAPVEAIARWDGASWTALGAGLDLLLGDPHVSSLLVFDDGSGPALFVGGSFDEAGGAPAGGLAKWQNATWSRVSEAILQVHSLVAHDDGQGLALHVGGTYQSEHGVGKWDGTSWTLLGGELLTRPEALLVYDDGNGPALYAAASSLDSGDSFLSRWALPEDLDPPTLACPPAVFAEDATGSPSGASVSFTVTASDCRDPAPSVVCAPPSGSSFPRGTTLVTCTATDASGNQSACQFPVIVTLGKARRR